MSLCKAGSRFAARLLLISALAATLIGCCSASQQTHQSLAGRGLYQAHHERSQQMHSKRRVLPGQTVAAKRRHRIGITTPTIAAKTETPPPSQPHDESVTTPTIAAKTETSPQLDDESAIKKAKATIAAKMSDPNSIEFEQVERAVSKNALGDSVDTICGYVRDKNSLRKLFLYIVQNDEAYIGGYPIATSQFRNICSITTLPGR
jgi:hypothetical protein